jgi:hypothetical protein
MQQQPPQDGDAHDEEHKPLAPLPAQFTSFTVLGSRFDVDSKYSLIKPIGQGAFGVVW